MMVSLAVEGALQTAEGIGPEVVAQVVEAIPDKNLPMIKHEV